MEIKLDELFYSIEGAEVLLACSDLWAEYSIDNDKVVLDGLYIIPVKDDFEPLYKQGKTLDAKEHGMLFDAAEAYFKRYEDDLVIADFEASDVSRINPNDEHRLSWHNTQAAE